MGTKPDIKDAEFSAAEPLTAGMQGAQISASTTAASTGTLAVGTYVVRISGATGLAWGSLAGAATVPGSSLQASTFPLADGERLKVKTAAALSVILSTGTATVGVGLLE